MNASIQNVPVNQLSGYYSIDELSVLDPKMMILEECMLLPFLVIIYAFDFDGDCIAIQYRNFPSIDLALAYDYGYDGNMLSDSYGMALYQFDGNNDNWLFELGMYGYTKIEVIGTED